MTQRKRTRQGVKLAAASCRSLDHGCQGFVVKMTAEHNRIRSIAPDRVTEPAKTVSRVGQSHLIGIEDATEGKLTRVGQSRVFQGAARLVRPADHNRAKSAGTPAPQLANQVVDHVPLDDVTLEDQGQSDDRHQEYKLRQSQQRKVAPEITPERQYYPQTGTCQQTPRISTTIAGPIGVERHEAEKNCREELNQ